MVENVPLYDIGGKILDKQGEPIADVIVQIGTKTTMTDVNGEWKITSVQEGNYTVYAGKYDYVFAQQELNAEGDNSTAIEVDIDVLREINLGALTASHNYTCALKADNTVVCWGKTSSNPGIPPQGTFSQISANGYHTCGIEGTANHMTCWDNYSNKVLAFPIPVSQVSSGAQWAHFCGVNGGLICWGYDSSMTSSHSDQKLSQVSIGFGYICSLGKNGTIICSGYNGYQTTTPPKDIFVQISTGYRHACGVKIDGTVACWGKYNKTEHT
jgi:hypothetical protein